MDYTMGIAALILTVVLWLLYHKIVTVIYHGNMGSHIIKELFGCFIVSVLLVSTVSVVAGKLLSAVGGVLLFFLKAALIVAGIAVVVFLIATIAKAISSKKSDGNDSCDRSSQSAAKPVSEKTEAVSSHMRLSHPRQIIRKSPNILRKISHLQIMCRQSSIIGKKQVLILKLLRQPLIVFSNQRR